MKSDVEAWQAKADDFRSQAQDATSIKLRARYLRQAEQCERMALSLAAKRPPKADR